jgi:hypothetical protein
MVNPRNWDAIFACLNQLGVSGTKTRVDIFALARVSIPNCHRVG